MQRKRRTILILLILLMLSGLYSRSDLPLPVFLRQYAGDVLWALMVYFVFAFLFPKARIGYLLAASLVCSYAIEYSQLLTWDWLVYLRTTAARYVLGQGFVWSDLLCYTAGVVAAACLDHAMTRKGGSI